MIQDSSPLVGGNGGFTVNDMDALTYKQLQSSWPFRLVRFFLFHQVVCALLSLSLSRKRSFSYSFAQFSVGRPTQSLLFLLFDTCFSFISVTFHINSLNHHYLEDIENYSRAS